MAVEPLCQAAPYSLRPLAALLNPYARGCSVLCNHPADTQSRDALRRVKETWPTERVLAGEDALPEELFRRYTDTDSRPHSPPGVGARHSRGPGPPLLAPPPSGATVAGAGQRRCRTPDPYHPHTYLHHPAELQQQQQPGQPQRTLLVLDLRRSRSHDTLSVAAATAASVGGEVMMSPEPPPLAASSPLPGAETAPDVVVTCADDSRTTEDEVVRRRGKKRRGKKSGKDALREPEKEIHGFPEPGETQVSAIGDESHNPSTRPSLTGTGLLASGGSFGAAYGPGMAAARAAAEEAARLRSVASSFLDAESLTHLQRDLDLETVECEFDAKRRLALEEAFRLLPKHAKRRVRDRVRDGAGVDAPPANPAADGESQPGSGGLLGIPRVFSLRSARFELPLNSAALNYATT
ncbi:hypothetical protein FOCC_FOCC015805 [Frankliniella occidentalis]|nr:hypothetical protein FOCC_FOCC015805 [Frankliniella occidentalis]